jgi:hypothetical protein
VAAQQLQRTDEHVEALQQQRQQRTSHVQMHCCIV